MAKKEILAMRDLTDKVTKAFKTIAEHQAKNPGMVCAYTFPADDFSEDGSLYDSEIGLIANEIEAPEYVEKYGRYAVTYKFDELDDEKLLIVFTLVPETVVAFDKL